MSLLARLESDLREALARAFTDSRVSLVDVGRALVAEDEAAGPTDGPRVFDVSLHPDDLEGLRAHAGALCRRLAELVADQRAERGPSGGQVDVRLEPDPSLDPGVFRVGSSADGVRRPAAGSGAGGATATRGSGGAADGGPGPSPLPGRPRLSVVFGGNVVSGTAYADGRMVELELDEHVAVVGSAPDCNLLLPEGLVAPEHVEVRYRSDGYHEALAIGDAPMRVNGQPGAKGLLTDGARLDLGEVAILYRRDITPRESAGETREGFSRTSPQA